MKHIKLREFIPSKQEKETLIDYAVSLGYIIDFEPEEFEGKYPVIRNKLNGKYKGYIQRYKGDLWYIYGTKRENISLSYNILKGLESYYKKSKGNMKMFLRLTFGILDFELKE